MAPGVFLLPMSSGLCFTGKGLMASQKKRRKDYLESSGVPVIFVASVKGQGKAVTVLDDSTQCYTWSKSGRIDRRKDKTEIQTYVCTTCRAINAKANQGQIKKKNIELPTKKLIKFEDGHAEWVSKEYHDEHVRGCKPQDGDKVLAEGMVQDQINTISSGILKCTAGAAVKGVESKLTQLYANRGQDEKMMLFGSKAQLEMLAKSEYLVCDGTFATAPKRTMQTYRVFAQIENKETGSFCFAPAITCLLKNKTQATYKAMWIKKITGLSWIDRLFSLFDLPAEAPKTTNIAESYHAHLVHHFRSKKVTLGTWITDFRDLHNMEVLICEDVIRGKEIPVHLNEEYRRNAAEIEEAKRQLQDDDLEGIFDASHNSSMESVNTAKLGQYLVVVGAHMGNSENNKRRIAETGTEDPEISDEEIAEEENDEEKNDENDEPLDENYRGMESSIEFEESESEDEDSQSSYDS
ncbi:hypothetical protein DdX_11240 [Ditylenchus destructor]|uniref:MULE transposase domain-containing protein n=1 Tax=Ditylenchus destructor TaxID=166010 RepID=A0AAD4MWH0_9BILA|nr:hypothetical protein DdX_11240 [Ditylenchus destructor]